MKFSGETIVAPRLPSRRATYPPAKPPPITSVPPSAFPMGRVLRDFGQPLGEEPPLRLRLCELERAPVRHGCLVESLESTQEIGSRGVVEVVLVERKVAHEREPGLGAGRRGHRDGAVELDDR